MDHDPSAGNDDVLHQQLTYVERVGRTFEAFGLPPMTGRILGWLLICDPPEQSMNDLTDVLDASKGSISTSLQMLTVGGLVERTGIPGERRGYYRIQPDAWSELLRQKMQNLSVFTDLAREGIALMDDLDLRPKRRLEEMRAFYGFFEREIPALLERWEQTKEAE